MVPLYIIKVRWHLKLWLQVNMRPKPYSCNIILKERLDAPENIDTVVLKSGNVLDSHSVKTWKRAWLTIWQYILRCRQTCSFFFFFKFPSKDPRTYYIFHSSSLLLPYTSWSCSHCCLSCKEWIFQNVLVHFLESF